MGKEKKKLGQTKVGQFLAKSGLVNNLLDAIPDKGILGIVKNILVKDNTLPPVDKEQALKLLEMDMAEMEAVTRRWEADAKSFLENKEVTGTLRYSKKWLTVLDKYTENKIPDKNQKIKVLILGHTPTHTSDWKRMFD